MLASAALLALAGAASVSAIAVPTGEIARLKRDYIRTLGERSKLAKRQSVTTGADDVTVLNFALTLEHLEAKFYHDALQKFNQSAFDQAGYSGLYPVLQQVAKDEQAHVDFLTSALSAAGATPVQACNYTFPYTDVPSFLGLSQVVEGVGVSAYLGAAGSINDTSYLTAAGSILTVEARHNAFIRYVNAYTPFPQPEDTPQSASNVVTIVTPFFTSCPSGSAPAIQGHPALNVTSKNFTMGAELKIAPTNASAVNTNNGQLYCGFASGLAAGFSNWSNGACMIPTQNISSMGQTYVVLTTGPSLDDKSTVAGPAIIDLSVQNVTVTLPSHNSTSSGSGSGSSSSSGSGSSGSGSAGSSNSNMTSGASTVKMGFAGAAAAVLGAVVLMA
ncbi:Ferritin/ribonucleotide reductase-like protein [Rhodosporidium toruloides NP11] [Rhodotorula toruloides]|uniref:BY PROTMAP: gi/472583909/gb/EMS21525.1/ Ferritin/ribonucleotide reductase-like protein [Rhodosporidium toruloides NP11] n=1 Tax=Rhodotorula toruloides TaxID=5286 RepID=A0A0K3CNJ7_RHOTO|nr:Ferritin/ribonucleotide reductase-like protein [Rhodosporidium toruloides NP11] [Rhodotorula toruloides]PRQ70216.1 Ferritin-like domain-domain containing protein [Rhodotorula toruloides]